MSPKSVLDELRAEAKEYLDNYDEQAPQDPIPSGPRTPRELFYDFAHGGKFDAHWAGAATCEPIAERTLKDAESIISPERIQKLAARLHAVVRTIESAVADFGKRETFNPAMEWPAMELDGMLAYDRIAFDALRTLPNASAFAAEIDAQQQPARDRWQRHLDGDDSDLWRLWMLDDNESGPDIVAAAPRIIAFAAAQIWKHELADDFAAARGQPAISGLPSMMSLVRCRRRDAVIDVDDNGATIGLDGAQEGLLKPSEAVPQITVEVAEKLASSLAGSHMRPMLGHILKKAQSQFVTGDKSGQVDFYGGFEGLCDAMGYEVKRDRCDQLRQACDALSCLHIRCAGGYGGVFNYWHYQSSRGRHAKLRIYLMGPLQPGYSTELKRVEAKHRKLVPVIVDLPSYVGGRPNEHGAQAVLVDRIVLYMRENAMEIFDDGYITIEPGKWRALLDESGVSRRIGDNLLSAWTEDRGGRPALLEAGGGDRYRLAGHHQEARDMLIAGGKMDRKGREAGRKSARRRGRR